MKKSIYIFILTTMLLLNVAYANWVDVSPDDKGPFDPACQYRFSIVWDGQATVLYATGVNKDTLEAPITISYGSAYDVSSNNKSLAIPAPESTASLQVSKMQRRCD